MMPTFIAYRRCPACRSLFYDLTDICHNPDCRIAKARQTLLERGYVLDQMGNVMYIAGESPKLVAFGMVALELPDILRRLERLEWPQEIHHPCYSCLDNPGDNLELCEDCQREYFLELRAEELIDRMREA